jgi:outer membrane protein OmpA-like peptidoglycan-associated protein
VSDEQQPLPAESNLTEPSVKLPPVSGTVPPEASVTPSEGWLSRSLTLVFRLLLLGVGIPVAWLLGVGVAQWLPSGATQPPFQEVALRKTNRVLTEIRRLPGRWQVPAIEQTRIEPVPIPTEPVEPLTTPVEVLSDREKQSILEELNTIQADLNTLGKRLVDLETRLGYAQSTASVESRLATLKAGLANTTEETTAGETAAGATDGEVPAEDTAASILDADTAPDSAVPPPDTLATTAPKDPLFQVTDLQVTLPSDALFAPGEARLLETAPLILNTILTDLSRYPDATLVIGSHTDDRLDVPTSRELALKQANALQAYLASNLAETHHWVTVGYGQSQPLTHNQSPEARQRNRRVEIWVDR